MKSSELIAKLSDLSPDTEVIGGLWNGHVDTYTVLNRFEVLQFEDICNDFYGTPGAFDNDLLKIRSEKVAYIGSMFEELDEKVIGDRRITWRLGHVLRQHRSEEWKKERVYQMVKEFLGEE